MLRPTIALATPCIDEVNEHEKTYLAEAAGVEVVSMKGLGIVGSLPQGRLQPHVGAELAHEVDRREADAILISCTDFRTIEVIGLLEEELGEPVISSTQATFWCALRRTGYASPISG